MKLLIFLSLVVVSFASENECPPNEIFKTCGTACEPTCSNPHAASLPCPQVCVPNKCQCAPGYVRNSIGTCVKPSECTETACAKNEQFYECGTHCEPTCEIPNPSCIKLCKPNVCQCSEGFVRNQAADCVSIGECPKPQCGKNEEFFECGTYCEPTCETPNPICVQACQERVCQCSKGFMRHGKDCIPKEQCPK